MLWQVYNTPNTLAWQGVSSWGSRMHVQEGAGVSGALSAAPRFCCEPTRALKNSQLIKLMKRL